MFGEVISAYTTLDGNVKGKDHWRDLAVDHRILLKWILNRFELDLYVPEQGATESSCEHVMQFRVS
jgi:hypothetical protein